MGGRTGLRTGLSLSPAGGLVCDPDLAVWEAATGRRLPVDLSQANREPAITTDEQTVVVPGVEPAGADAARPVLRWLDAATGAEAADRRLTLGTDRAVRGASVVGPLLAVDVAHFPAAPPLDGVAGPPARPAELRETLLIDPGTQAIRARLAGRLAAVAPDASAAVVADGDKLTTWAVPPARPTGRILTLAVGWTLGVGLVARRRR